MFNKCRAPARAAGFANRLGLAGAPKQALIWGIVALAFSPTAPAAENDPGEQVIQRKIEAVVGDRHPTEDASWWRGLGAAAPAVIMRLYGTASGVATRTRLLQGLAYFNDPTAIEFMKREAETTSSGTLRGTAVAAVVESAGADGVEFAERFLTHSDTTTRLRAAQAISRVNSEAARAAMQRFRAREKNASLLAQLDHPSRTGRVTEGVPIAGAALAPVSSSATSELEFLKGRWQGSWTDSHGARVFAAAFEVDADGRHARAMIFAPKASAPKAPTTVAKQPEGAASFELVEVGGGLLRFKLEPGARFPTGAETPSPRPTATGAVEIRIGSLFPKSAGTWLLLPIESAGGAFTLTR